MQADSPDNPAPPGEAEPIDAEFEPAKPQKPSGGGRAAVRMAGFLLMLALAGGLGGAAGWYASSLDQPDAGSAELTRLETQIATLEARLNAAEDRPLTEMVPTEALRGFDSEIRALEERLEAVEARPAPEAAGGLDAIGLQSLLETRDAALRSELDTLRDEIAAAVPTTGAAVDLEPVQASITALETRLQGAEEATEAGLAALSDRQTEAETRLTAELREGFALRDETVEQRLEAFEARLSEVEASAGGEAAAVERSAARILAFTALREAAQGSESFEAERANLARLWPGAPGLQALQPHARSGMASIDDLEMSFPAAAIRSASGETRRFMGLFEIRPANSAPDSALALVRQAESRLERGDLAGAVEAAGRLEGPAAQAASDWLAQARARLDIEDTLTTLRNALSQDAATPGRSTP